MAEIRLIQIKDSLVKYWPLISSISLLWVSIIVLYFISIKLNQGNFIYALDDAYIHLAISKNFLLNGVYGITSYGFTSASSSIIWSVLLSSIFYVSGLNSIVPFILNVIFATTILIVIYHFLKSFKMNNFYIFLILLAITFFTPLPALIFTGMEHTLQILLMIPFAYLSARMLVKNEIENIEIILLLLLTIGVTLVRYEDLFMVIIVSFLFLIRRKYAYSFGLFGLALIPIIIYGIISTLKGWYFLPNSLIFKSTLQTDVSSSNLLFNVLNHLFTQIISTPVILVLIILTLAIIFLNLYKKNTFWNMSSILSTIFLSTTFLHLIFANIGWFYRYEAYLVVLGIFTVSIGFCSYIKNLFSNFNRSSIPKIVGTSLIILALFAPMMDIGYQSLVETPQATNNIYDQQYQMGLFVKQYYNNQTVALVDVGAVNYLADVNCLDLRGLTNLNISKHLQKGDYNTQIISEFVEQNNPSVIIVYDGIIKSYGDIPSNWIKVAEWKISNNVVCEFDTISFYVTNEKDKDQLIRNLKDFSGKLPEDVKQTIFE